MRLARLVARLLPAFLAAGVAPMLSAGGQSPREILERFFKAYNRHEADAIAPLFQADAALWRLGEERPAVSGREGLRQFFQDEFREHPKAKAKAVERMELAAWIAVLQKTTLEPGEPARETLVVFEIAGGLIRRLWVAERGLEMGEEPGGGEGVVAIQVEKWNQRDLPRFLAAYDPGASLFLLSTGERLAAGEEALRERYETIFESNPHLHEEVLQRIALGPWVAYRERVVMNPEDGPMESIAIYEVRDSLIRRVWFLR